MATPDFRETINVPIAIPAWSLFSALFIGVFIAGTLYNQMSGLIENSKKNDDRLTSVAAEQIRSGASIIVLQQLTQNHEQRLLNVENVAYNRAGPKR